MSSAAVVIGTLRVNTSALTCVVGEKKLSTEVLENTSRQWQFWATVMIEIYTGSSAWQPDYVETECLIIWNN